MRIFICASILVLFASTGFAQDKRIHGPANNKSGPFTDQPDNKNVIVSIHDIQNTTDPSGDSPYAGKTVGVRAMVTAVFVDGYVVADASGPWSAVYVDSLSDGPRIGDKVEVIGTVIEQYNMTQISDVTSCKLLSTGNTVDPWQVAVADAPKEMHESVLIEVENVSVKSLEDCGEWIVSKGGDLRCDDLNDYMYFPQVGDQLDSLAGILFYRFGEFTLEPRHTADINGDVIPHYVLRGDVVTMNQNLDVLDDAYVEILGDRIVGITSNPPPDLLKVDTGGLIFPGLIDGHNHHVYNVLDHIPFGKTFADRYEWHAVQEYFDFLDQFGSIMNCGGAYAQAPNLYKLAEVRALCAGTTTIQSSNCNGHAHDYYARQGMVINNAERFPSRIYEVCFPLSLTPAFWKEKQGEYWERFVVHLSEGVNAGSLQEFYTWQNWGMMDSRTTIIHGVALDMPEWRVMAENDISLVWSPTSNWVLYGATPNVVDALAAGVNVAIAPDWTPSGGRNMLTEMKFGDQLNQQLWGGAIQPVQFALFATRNAAFAMGAQDRIGQVWPGFQADLMVVPDGLDPYQALLDAESTDVKLTIVSGRPMYGDAALMKQFPFLDDLEEVTLDNHLKTLAIQIDAHGIPYSDRPFLTVIADLKSAYAASYPKICYLLCEFD